MNTKQKLDLAKWAVAEAKKAGANEVAADVSSSRDVEVSFRDAKLDKLKEEVEEEEAPEEPESEDEGSAGPPPVPR